MAARLAECNSFAGHMAVSVLEGKIQLRTSKMRHPIVSAFITIFTVLFIAGCGSSKQTAPSIPEYDPATATARVFGNINFEGTPPKVIPVQTGGSAYCVRNGHGIVDEEVLVTSDNKLRNVIVYVRTGQEGHIYKAPSEAIVLDQQKCVYVPHVLTAMTNQQLLVRNSDPTFHNVHGNSEVNPAFNFAQTEKGAEKILTFMKSEAHFHVGCDLHRWMGAYIGVFDHPFHTTSGTTGSYELRLPQGKYEIVAWHEKYGEKVMTVDLAEKSTMELNFAFDAKAAN
jgi:hypothetical protein